MATLPYLLWLTGREGLRPETAAALLRRFGTAEAVYFADEKEFELLQLPGRLCRSLADKSLAGAEHILADCDRLGIFLVTCQDAAYPERLRQLHDYPLVLYGKGKLPRFDEELAIAMVGSRDCTPYGVNMAGRLGLELARSGALVISGLAQGVDAASLKGALQGGGTVVSVLAGGVDVPYPFQNREVFAVPGPADAPMSAGTNGLIARGEAKLTRSAQDILVEYETRFPHKVRRPPHLTPAETRARLGMGAEAPRPAPRAEETGEERPAEEAGLPLRPRSELEGLGDEQRQIFFLLSERALVPDEIVGRTEIPARRVNTALTLLQAQGYVTELPGRRFAAAVRFPDTE